jgi:endonuclease/exonuclease/phosphatase family metal-dependent hydrolase
MTRPRLSLLSLLGATLIAAAPAAIRAEPFRILSWNVESNRPKAPPVSDPDVIGGQLTALLEAPATRAQIVALTEVDPKTVPEYRQAVAKGLGAEVDFVTSASGGFKDSDSLLLVVDAGRFAIDEVFELHKYKGRATNFVVMDPTSPEYGTIRARSPLVARLRDKTGGITFWLVVCHLARGEADLRVEQAKALTAWAADHASEPVVAAGDFNFDYVFATGTGNSAYDAMMAGDVWRWLQPDPPVDSNWTHDPEHPGQDKYPGSILDFVFVANGAKSWRAESDVVVREGDFPDTERTSDHRPIITALSPAP